MDRPAIHPGEILADELSEHGVTASELSRQIAVAPNRVSQILQGKRSITGDTALRLGHWFKTSPEFWLNLQTAYDLRRAAQEIGSAISALPTRTKKVARETGVMLFWTARVRVCEKMNCGRTRSQYAKFSFFRRARLRAYP